MHTHTHVMSEPTLIGSSPALERLRSSASVSPPATPRCSLRAKAASARISSRGDPRALGARAARAFIAVNCAGLTETLLESELFGHVKGSFTGAYRDKPGKLQLAQSRHAVPRRSRRDEPAHAGAAPALPGERRDPVRRRGSRRGHGGRPRRRGDEPQSGRHGREAGSSAKTCCTGSASFTFTCRRCASARKTSALLVEHLVAKAGARGRVLRRGPADARALSLARQRPRAPERRRAGALDGERQHVSTWPTCRRRSGGRPTGCCQSQGTPQAGGRRALQALVSGGYSFWEHIHPLFLERDITRPTCGSWCVGACRDQWQLPVAAAAVRGRGDYKRFLNFLAAHDCNVDFREFRAGQGQRERLIEPPLRIPTGPAAWGLDTASPLEGKTA